MSHEYYYECKVCGKVVAQEESLSMGGDEWPMCHGKYMTKTDDCPKSVWSQRVIRSGK